MYSCSEPARTRHSKIPAAILLAAGKGVRFGGNKLFYLIDGKPMYRYMYDALLLMLEERKISRLIVVTSCGNLYNDIRQNFRPESRTTGVTVVSNPEPDLGISHSIFLGLDTLKKLEPDAGACLFSVADQPWFRAASLEKLLDSFSTLQKGIAACAAENVIGNPVIFSSVYFQELSRLKGDRGGKQLLKSHPDDVALIQVPAKELRDLDFRPSEFQKFPSSLPSARIISP